MARLAYLTDKPVRVLDPEKQPLRLAVDVGDVDELDLLLVVYEGIDVTVKIITGMQTESELGWVDAGSFTTVGANEAAKLNLTNLLRYVRWEVTSVREATFTIAGIARNWS
jgi:hypothetical protein